MEKKCLVKETSVNYSKKNLFIEDNFNQMPKDPRLVTKKAIGMFLEKINFLNNVSNDDILLDTPVILPSFLKNLVNVSVQKSFAMDIELDKMAGKSSQEKLVVVKRLFSKVNSFGRAFIPSKFSGIIHASFISKASLTQIMEKARAADILVNTDLKKSTIYSDQAVVVKKISVGILAKAVCAVLSEFGSVMLIKMQLAVIEFAQSDQADLVAARWSILIRKNAVRVAKTNADKESWNMRNQHRALLYTLLMGTNIYDIWDFIGSVDGKTCVID
ncbi:hypothetical protein G9A89_006282 [Geosiphon pyriformis]|nr:hypothetical protein G9A89_006282 [Geosiphon pyriformis]